MASLLGQNHSVPEAGFCVICSKLLIMFREGFTVLQPVKGFSDQMFVKVTEAAQHKPSVRMDNQYGAWPVHPGSWVRAKDHTDGWRNVASNSCRSKVEIPAAKIQVARQKDF